MTLWFEVDNYDQAKVKYALKGILLKIMRPKKIDCFVVEARYGPVHFLRRTFLSKLSIISTYIIVKVVNGT